MATISFNQFLKQAGGTAKDVKTTTPQVTQTQSTGFDVMGALKGQTSFPASESGTLGSVGENLLKTAGNIPSSAAGLIRGAIAPVNPLDIKSPLNIGANIVGSGSALKDIYQQRGFEQGTKDILGGFADTYLKLGETIYGGLDKAYNALLDNPKKAVADVTAQIAKIGIEDPLLIPAILYGSGKLTGGKDNISRLASPITRGADTSLSNIAVKTSESLSPTVTKAGTVLKGAGEGAYGLTVTPTEATAKAVLNYDAQQPTLFQRVKNFLTGEEPVGIKPITEANTAARKGLMGTEYQIGVQSKKISTSLWNDIIEPKLNEVKGKVNFKNFLSEIEKDIAKTPELGRRKDLMEAFTAFSEDFKNVSNISLKKLQEYKEGWATFIPEKTYKGKPIGSAFKDIQNKAAEKARSVIYKNIGEEGKQAYLDYGNLQSIIESGIKSTTGDAAKRSLGRNIWEFVMDKAVTPIATVSGKVLYKTGEGLQFIGEKGAKTVKDILIK